jgi:hypothetical protein
MEHKVTTTSGCFLIFIITAVVSVIAILLKGWVLQALWGWFIVDPFNAPALSLRTAIGVVLVVSYLTHQDIPVDQEDKRGTWENFFIQVLKLLSTPILTYVMGYVIVHL